MVNDVNIQFFQPSGWMDRDSSFWNIATNKGNYYDALNVSGVNLTGNANNYMSNVEGNTLAFVLPTIAAQNKLYQILYTSTTLGQILSVQFLNVNGSQFPTNTVSSTTATGVLINDISSLATAISNTLGTNGYTSNIYANQTWNGTSFVTLDGSIIVEITQQMGFDYTIINNSTATNTATITIVQEAWDTTLTGLCIPTGSNGDLGDLFIISSPVGNDPETFTINGTVTGTPGAITISGNVSGKITAGMSVYISGVNGTTEANGTWIVTSSSYAAPNTTIRLFNTHFSNAYTSGGVLTLYTNGLINIDVHVWNQTANTWTNTVLLQTKQVNARWNHPERRVLEDTVNGITNLYFTDNNDVPRIFSYQGAYSANGAFLFFNALGLYTYEGVNFSMNLQLSNAMPIISTATVIDSGGAVTSGNWRYAVTLQDATGTQSLPSMLSAPVEIFVADLSNPITIVGSPLGAGSPTSKQVQLNIIDIPVGVYTELNLIGINYIQDTEVAYLIKTVTLNSTQSSIIITHTGNETYVNYDTSLLDQTAVTYTKAGDLTIASNTLLMADLTGQEISDFTAWAKTFQHTISKSPVLNSAGDDLAGYQLGDYQDPNATFNYVGYMDNETYRFGVVVELLNGTRTNAFWIDDIRMDNYQSGGVPFNRANPYNNNRRISSFTNYDLSDNTLAALQVPLLNIKTYVTNLTFSNINFDFLVSGQPISQIAKRIHIVRIDNLSTGLNEIRGCGLLRRHTYGWAVGTAGGGSNYSVIQAGGAFESVNNVAFDNPFMLLAYIANVGYFYGFGNYASIVNNFTSPPAGFAPFSYGAWTNGSWNVALGVDKYSGSFYCPDALYNQNTIDWESGDKIYCYGQPEFRWLNNLGQEVINNTIANAYSNVSPLKSGIYFKMCGATGITNWGNATDNLLIGVGNSVTPVSTFSGAVGWNPNSVNGLSPAIITSYTGQTNTWAASQPTNPFGSWYNGSHYLLACLSEILQNNPNMGNTGGHPTVGAIDIGLYYIQYYRDKGSLTAWSNAAQYPNNTKFGAVSTGVYVPTNAYLDVSSGIVSLEVYGGDTFTQRNYLKLVTPDIAPTGRQAWGAGSACSFYCQNYFNFNMRQQPGGDLFFPESDGGNVSYYVQTDISTPEGFSYDSGYTPRNIDNEFPAWNPTLPQITDYSNRKIFSLPKPQGSYGNPYRQFPPLNFEDNSPDDGIIRAMFTVNGEIHTLQDYAFNRHFYNERGSLVSSEASGTTSIVLGSGTPFSKPYEKLSSIGCTNQFSLLFGRTPDGDDLRAWIDIIGKNVMLYSRGKLRVISIERMMRTWFYNNLNLTGDIPVLSNAITGVWDDKRKEFIWTIFQSYNAPAWSPGTSYVKGNLVSNGTNFEGMPITYKAITSSIGVEPPPAEPLSASISGTILGTNGMAGIRVGSDVTSNIVAGSTVIISGVSGTTEANGTWTVNTSTYEGTSGGTAITLKNATFSNTYTSGGTVYSNPPPSTSWIAVGDYYTIVYNTLIDGFTTFLTPIPYFYAPYFNTYLTAYPNTTYNGMYISDFGNYCEWYSYAGNTQSINGSLTWIVNENSRQDKRYVAFSLNCLLNPYTINCNTFKQNTYMGITDTYQYLDRWLCPVKNDTVTSPDGTPSNDSSALFGQWMQTQLVFQYGVQQSLMGTENKFYYLSRYINR